MKRQLETHCDSHSDPFECVDQLVIYSSRFNEYGIIIHDGGNSYSVIYYCPWCGKELPKSKRDLWFDTLKARGFDNPTRQKIPAEYQTNEWYQPPTKGPRRLRTGKKVVDRL